MKSLIAISIAALSLSAFAQEDLNAMKQKANSHIDKKMSTLKTAKGCVNGASSMEAFKACKFDMHEDMKMQKMEAMEEKKVQKDSEE
jgi:hypothetical protein